jgi:hypothetical protein
MASSGRSAARAALTSVISVPDGVHVRAARQQHAGTRPHDGVRRVRGGIQRPRFAAGEADGLYVVGHLPARGDGDARRHGYIRDGTSIPIRSSALVICTRK